MVLMLKETKEFRVGSRNSEPVYYRAFQLRMGFRIYWQEIVVQSRAAAVLPKILLDLPHYIWQSH